MKAVEPERPLVVVFNQAAVPMTMAGGTRHVELFTRLVGWRTSIIAGNRSYLDQKSVPSSDVLRAVPVIRHTGGGVSRVLNWISYMVSATAVTLRSKPSVVWGSSPQMGAALVGLGLARRRKVPFILEIRDLWPHILVERGVIEEHGWGHRQLTRLEEFLYRRADAIVVLAEGTRHELDERGFGGSLEFIPNGADVEAFDLARSEGREPTGGDLSEQFVVVYAGAHGPANGLHRVVDAAAELAASESSAHFVLIGDGVDKPKLVERVQAQRLDNVTFVDPVPKNEIPSFYAVANLGLHCLDDLDLFRYGVSPNKVYDYMAAALPVLTNVKGEVAELVTTAAAGLAVGPDGIASGVRIAELMTPNDRAMLGENGRRFVMSRRSREASARQVEQLLNRLVQEREGK